MDNKKYLRIKILKVVGASVFLMLAAVIFYALFDMIGNRGRAKGETETVVDNDMTEAVYDEDGAALTAGVADVPADRSVPLEEGTEEPEISDHDREAYFRLLRDSGDCIYLALRGHLDIGYLFENGEDYDIEAADKTIVNINGNIIKGNRTGETYLIVKNPMNDVRFRVVVTDLIIEKGDDFNYDKEFITEGVFTEEDNDLLDEILENRVRKAGYLTRAGAVEAARFLTLEFAYRIGYFNENGRLANDPKADGEGRYYHKGLYLHSSRFEELDSQYIIYGPNPWGYPIYSDPIGRVIPNGLDCSGFTGWALYQAGYDPGDLGAGVNPTRIDFTDLGEKERLTEKTMDNLKVGDLLAGTGSRYAEAGGGHISLLIGIKDNKYYVAETLWGAPTKGEGLVAMKYTYDEMMEYFYWRVDMDEFYGQDGNLTDFWN